MGEVVKAEGEAQHEDCEKYHIGNREFDLATGKSSSQKTA
jgi:hypothetical protein